jgi:hypothetical protein
MGKDHAKKPFGIGLENFKQRFTSEMPQKLLFNKNPP